MSQPPPYENRPMEPHEMADTDPDAETIARLRAQLATAQEALDTNIAWFRTVADQANLNVSEETDRRIQDRWQKIVKWCAKGEHESRRALAAMDGDTTDAGER